MILLNTVAEVNLYLMLKVVLENALEDVLRGSCNG